MTGLHMLFPTSGRSVSCSLAKYRDDFQWLKDGKFLQELERDSIDIDTIEEELHALRQEEVFSVRRRITSFLQRNPVQIFLCVLVLFDVCIGITQLLIDIHAVRERLTNREEELDTILRNVRSLYEREEVKHHHNYHHQYSALLDRQLDLELVLALLHSHPLMLHHHHQRGNITLQPINNLTSLQQPSASLHGSNNQKNTAHAKLTKTGDNVQHRHPQTGRGTGNDITERVNQSQNRSGTESNNNMPYMSPKSATLEQLLRRLRTGNTEVIDDTFISHVRMTWAAHAQNESGDVAISFSHVMQRDAEISRMMRIAHGLHCAGIAILALLVLEVYVKMAAMSKEFFRHKIEILDTVVISTSFVFDIVFLSDVQGEESEKAAAVVVILLMWRIARITDSILMTVKQRQEFRIRLQKCARRKAERKIEVLEDHIHTRMKEIAALKELCYHANVRKEEVEACCPRRERRTSSTLNALSSVAKMSFGMAMSMSSGSLGSSGALPTIGTEALSSPRAYRRHLVMCSTTANHNHLPVCRECSGFTVDEDEDKQNETLTKSPGSGPPRSLKENSDNASCYSNVDDAENIDVEVVNPYNYTKEDDTSDVAMGTVGKFTNNGDASKPVARDMSIQQQQTT